MNPRDLRSLLSAYRDGEVEDGDPRFDEARLEAANDPALAQWWADDQALDEMIAAKLRSTHVPPYSKESLASGPTTDRIRRSSWTRPLLAAAAALVALAVLFGSWRGPFQPAVSMADYRDEMVSFVKVPPNLELESKNLPRVQEFLANAKAPAGFSVPQKLKNLDPVGCRVLRFRGRDVSLVCFQRAEGKLIHLFVIDAAALPGSRAPEFAQEGEWMTVGWTEGGHAYLMTVQGDRSLAEKYLSSS